MSKFKVGDIVKATADMYGQTNRKYNWQGAVMQVNGSRFDAKIIKSTSPDNVVGKIYFWLNEDDFELVDSPCTKEIHISGEGNTVHAVMKEGGKVIKRSKAICSKDDEFDFQIGAELAFDRLFEKDKPKFVPYLRSDLTGVHCGTIGDKTLLKDNRGFPLFVGDIVRIYDKYSTNRSYVGFVCANELRPSGFIWGILPQCLETGFVVGWDVYKEKDFGHLESMESVNGVTAILEERIKCK